ncbi:hypothetical protein BGZ51_000853, partial [Haplosporangium sp. Z 767]
FLLCAASSSVVSAQTEPSKECLECVGINAIRASPTCDAETLRPPFPSDATQWTPKQKSCFCPLFTSDAWYKPCVGGSGGCTADDLKYLQDDSADPAVKAACAGSGGTTGTGTGTALSSNKVLSGAVLALVSAAVMFL